MINTKSKTIDNYKCLNIILSNDIVNIIMNYCPILYIQHCLKHDKEKSKYYFLFNNLHINNYTNIIIGRDIPNTFLTQLAKEIDKILKKNKKIQFSKEVFSEALVKLKKRKSIKMMTWIIVFSQMKYLYTSLFLRFSQDKGAKIH